MRVEDLLSPEASAAIEAAVGGAERLTSGEIVPMVVERSDGYADVRVGVAAIGAIAAGGVWLALAPGLDEWLVPMQVAVLAGLTWALGWRPLLSRLAPKTLLAERVRRAASLAFHREGIVETRDRTGILIFVSLLERRVEVLADRGIHSRVPDGTWDGVVACVLAGIRAGRADEGLVDAIRRCGEILAASFPPRPDDRNELPDGLR